MTLPLDELRRVDQADVHKAGLRAGTLRRTDGPVVFTYDAEYLGDDGPPVATTLRPDAGDDALVGRGAGALPPFFAGLLPEGRRLVALERAVKASTDDELTLLLAVGSDTVGDVQVVPTGELPIVPPDIVTTDDWTSLRFADLMERASGGSDRTALPGIQDKLSAGTISFPLSAGKVRAILKLDPPEYPHLVANEAFFLDAARASGISTAEATIVHDATGRPGLLVARFDRLVDGDDIRAVAQEDACQILGRYPADKYRVSTEAVVGALSDLSGAPLPAARDLVRQFAFDYLIGNGDAHAKNFSVRRVDGEWRPTPAYDVLSTQPYGDHTMALRLNEKQREDIGRIDLLALAAAVGVPERAAARVIDEVVDAADQWIDRLEELPFDGGRIVKLGKAIAYRRGRLA